MIRTMIALLLALVAAFGAQTSSAQFVYSLDAVPGGTAGSVLTGTITLPNSLAGDDIWNLGEADHFSFNLTFGGGLSFVPSGLIVSNDVRFNQGVGASIIRPVLPDATPGYSPDWRIDTTSGNTEYGLGIGHDLSRPIWNLFDAGAGVGVNFDFGDTNRGAPVAWRLVLVPEPGSVAMVAAGLLALIRRRR